MKQPFAQRGASKRVSKGAASPEGALLSFPAWRGVESKALSSCDFHHLTFFPACCSLLNPSCFTSCPRTPKGGWGQPEVGSQALEGLPAHGGLPVRACLGSETHPTRCQSFLCLTKGQTC